MDPKETFKVLPVNVKPGEINYLGLFQAKQIKAESNDDPYAFSTGILDSLGATKKSKLVLNKDDGYILKSNNQEIKSFYYPADKMEKNQDERLFLESFIAV